MSDRIDPLRRLGVDSGPVSPVTRVERRRRDPDDEEGQDRSHDQQPRRQAPKPPPDDGMPHVDVLA